MAIQDWERSRYDFSWETLRAFLEGVSPIDLDRLALGSREEAVQFLVQYGYDLAIPSEHHEAWAVYREAVDYLARMICPAPTHEDYALEMPAGICEVEDLPELLLLASQPGPLQVWSCALLRVMHTISHANHVVRSPFYEEIQRQILERYRQHVHTDDEGRLTLGTGLLAVALESIEMREEKNRDTLILKLLHRSDNVAQSVYDRIGVKLITPTKVDALLVLRYMRRHHLAIFAHVMPGRSRNNLIDLRHFRRVYEDLATPEADAGKSGWTALQQNANLKAVSEEASAPRNNPHSSSEFRSIQFTCRQLIRVPNPSYTTLTNLRDKLSQRLPQAEINELLGELKRSDPEPVLRFFFPYEVQIIDHENHLRSLTGASSHAEYRLRQLRTARRRVLGGLLAHEHASAEEIPSDAADAVQPAL